MRFADGAVRRPPWKKIKTQGGHGRGVSDEAVLLFLDCCRAERRDAAEAGGLKLTMPGGLRTAGWMNNKWMVGVRRCRGRGRKSHGKVSTKRKGFGHAVTALRQGVEKVDARRRQGRFSVDRRAGKGQSKRFGVGICTSDPWVVVSLR